MHVLTKAAVAAALLVGALPLPASHATWASAVGTLCTGTVTWTFTPPLSAGAGSGQVDQTWSGVCGLGVVGVSTDPPDAGEFHSLFGFDSTSVGAYSGDCVLATITMNGTAHQFIGGRVAIERNLALPWPEAGASVMTSDDICPISFTRGDRIVSSATVNTG